MNLETSFDFLAQLNDAEKGWGFWIDRNHIEQYHVGQYSFDNDRLPKSFIHVDSLENLAHERQKYIMTHAAPSLNNSGNNDETLSKDWAKTVLSNVKIA
ncbi:MAG: hypothetical protein J7647_32380 [Cyanobacteria bacterium SBLK]|nr:hypothetical protein [Cyanobacteria bacterium SBLK]